jgi:sugar O-acyltransferase (sialic acid O-acetyltransferase NeuD family)
VSELPVIIVGAGGHAAVVADALLGAGRRVLGFTDADPARQGTQICGLPVLGGDEVLGAHAPDAVVLANGIAGVKGVAARRAVQLNLQARGWRFTGVKHRTAVVSSFARIGNGVQLLASCVVQANAVVGDECIVNTAAIVEHDVRLGEWTHLSPRALLCGGVTVGARCHVGAGAIVKQNLRLVDESLVAAGAVVVKDCLERDGAWIGVPARFVGQKS